ncbi:MAG: DNA/RNA non-specific endonuclease [Parasporobacterium sp.]|nr:DNA/RNA non-specific endonuclease [Parasporobacterium sp.]
MVDDTTGKDDSEEIQNREEKDSTSKKKENVDPNQPSVSTCVADPESIPDFAGEDYIVLNDNTPNFTEYDIANITGENYSELDKLGRCGTAVALLDRTMMPEEERGQIGQIKPSGWHTVKYPDLIEDNYLYNRCHLIAYAMTGQNDNVLNLITGTRYLNATTMLPFEIQVLQYLDYSDNHVLYRVTPYFRDDELVARGVEMEAYSVEDEGEGVCFHVFVYNYQPGIEIDYLTGDSWTLE